MIYDRGYQGMWARLLRNRRFGSLPPSGLLQSSFVPSPLALLTCGNPHANRCAVDLMDAKRNRLKRRRLQFSLAGLLLLLTVSSIVIFVATRPRPSPTIEGTITTDGEALQGGTVEFIDESGKTIKGSVEKGRFSLSGDEVSPGRFKIVIEAGDQSKGIDPKRNGQ